MKICSACLLGINCAWNGGNKANNKVIELAKKELLIPVCPEQLGGLSTPRTPCEQKGDKVFNKNNKDETASFIRGAEEVLKIARLLKIKEAILKQKSPSCGSKLIYDGSFSGKLIEGNGITAKLLKENGIKVISEEDL